MMTGNVSLNSEMQNVTATKVAATDNVSSELQNQLAGKQQDLKRISSDSEMSSAEKQKERQKIQQQIAELNRELRRQQIEEQEKAKEAAKNQEKKADLKEISEKEQKADKVSKEETQHSKEHKSIEETTETKTQDAKKTAQTVQEMLNNEFLIQQERVQNNMAKQRDQQKDIIESEMNLDAIHGAENITQQEALTKMEKREEIIFEIQENINNPVEPSVGIRAGAKIIIRED